MSKNISSVSRIPILITLNNSVKMEGELIRHLSPLTIKKVLNHLPINQLINNFQKKFLQLKLELDIGLEKPQSSFKKGDIAFSSISNCIYIFLEDYTHSQKQFSRMGFIKTQNLDELIKTKAGDILTIQKI
ncbi:MAG TPA: cyclophilin-like fold protein [Candidatus Sulfopaludibacter sp.]|nr:cyclophilin-like fold protein [Candidatus Sulfopaludibacter sp.]